MNVLIFISAGAAAFALGFCTGLLHKPAAPAKRKKAERVFSERQKEYRNFLTYDGSEQE